MRNIQFLYKSMIFNHIFIKKKRWRALRILYIEKYIAHAYSVLSNLLLLFYFIL